MLLVSKRKKEYLFQKGFTFIETMLAVVVLTIGIIVVVQTFSLALNIERYNQMETQAVFLAQSKIEEQASQTYQNIDCCGVYSEDNLEAPFDNFSRLTTVYYLDEYLATTTMDTGLKKIKVMVTWPSFLKIRKNEVVLTSLSAKR